VPKSADHKLRPEVPDTTRLLAEPEDCRIEQQPKVVSGVVIPTGPPPPLPRRTATDSAPLPHVQVQKPDEVAEELHKVFCEIFYFCVYF
jgi:hypothetical protein